MPSDTNNATEYSEKYLHVKQKAVERAQARGETGTRVAAPRSQRLPPGQYLTDKFPVLDLGVQPMFLPDKFRLTIDGAVKNPVSLSLDDLAALPSIELTADFHCVTHWSRYDLHWTGIPFESLIDLVEPEPSVSHVMQYGKDGYTTNNSLEELIHPDVILAYALDGKPIPREHGAPIRIITPHLYAWKGAKFLNRIEFLSADKLGFWEVRGYHNHADPGPKSGSLKMDDRITVSLIPTADLSQILPLVKILNPDIEEELLARRLEEMSGQGYQCAGAYQGEKLVGICGLWVATRFYCGKYIEPDNVVVHPDYRSLGVGQKLMAWIYDYARTLNCEVVELNSYVGSPRAHKFYFNEGFQILGFHFQKRLGEE